MASSRFIEEATQPVLILILVTPWVAYITSVVLWLDDLQWADVLIIELLHRIARSLADRPVLIITAQREDADLDWPPAVDHPITVRMPLDPLTRDDAARLVEAVLGPSANFAFVDSVYERSGGNPLFLIELVTRAPSAPIVHAAAGGIVLWSGLYGATGRESAIVMPPTRSGCK